MAKDKDESSGLCMVGPIVEGRAYIEDGNHRTVARLLAEPSETLAVIRLVDR